MKGKIPIFNGGARIKKWYDNAFCLSLITKYCKYDEINQDDNYAWVAPIGFQRR